MTRKETLLKKIEELKEEVERLEKPWPDTFEEAMKESNFWGLVTTSGRYLVCSDGPGKGLAINTEGTWATTARMRQFWENSGEYDCFKYFFHKFDTAKELYQWLLEAEL